MTISQIIKKSRHLHNGKKHELVQSIRLINFKCGEVVTILPNLGAPVLELILKSGTELYSILESPGSLRRIIDYKQ